MFYVLKQVSGNRKTGPMPVSTSNSSTYPDACPIKLKGCYAKYGPTGMAWRNVDSGKAKDAVEWNEFTKEVKRLAKGSLWRHNQAGDLNGDAIMIDGPKLRDLVIANGHKRGFTYTHYDVLSETFESRQNALLVQDANVKGFTINLSGNDVAHADKLKALNIAPVVVLMPRDAERDYIIGFRAHGTAAKTVDLIAKG